MRIRRSGTAGTELTSRGGGMATAAVVDRREGEYGGGGVEAGQVLAAMNERS